MKAPLLFVAILGLASCEESTDSKTEAIRKQLDSVNYELSLRRDEIAEMETVTKKPGVVGVTREWLRRHNELKEKMTSLEVRKEELITELPANLRP
jgi:hypothetical protein